MKALVAVLLTIALLAVSVVPVSALDRDMSLEADGRVSIESNIENSSSQAATRVSGEGEVYYASDSVVGEDSFDQAHSIELQSAVSTLRPLKAIVGFKTEDNIYAILIRPDQGEGAFVDVHFEAAAGDDDIGFTMMEVSAHAEVTRGEFRSFIDVFDISRGISLREAIRVWGLVRFLDRLTLSVPVEDDEL